MKNVNMVNSVNVSQILIVEGHCCRMVNMYMSKFSK